MSCHLPGLHHPRHVQLKCPHHTATRLLRLPLKKRPLPVTPLPVKNRAAFPAENSGLPQELGECIHRYVDFLKHVGCHRFVKTRSNRGNLANFSKVENHPTRWLLMLYKHQGVPVKFSSPNWSRTKMKAVLLIGAYKSCNYHINFLSENFVNMIKKGQWLILPTAMTMELEGLRLSQFGVILQHERRPRWI